MIHAKNKNLANPTKAPTTPPKTEIKITDARIKVPRGCPDVLSQLASFVQTRGEVRGIEPLMRRHSDGMKASFHSAPR